MSATLKKQPQLYSSVERNYEPARAKTMINAEKATVESLTDYYKQHYYEGEYSVGDLCVMLARAEVGIEAMAETLAMAEITGVERDV